MKPAARKDLVVPRNIVIVRATTLLVCLAGSFSLDRASKAFVLDAAARGAELPAILSSLTLNRGINFGLFAADSDALQIVLASIAGSLALGFILACIFYLRRPSPPRLFFAGSGLLVGGAISNAADRLVHGGVVDFISPSCCGYANPYAFNFADVAIFIGIGLVMLVPWKKDQTRDV